MNTTNNLDESKINALADGELDTVESQILLDEIKNDPEMQRALCDTHLLKDMIQMAYPDKQDHTAKQRPQHRKNFFGAIAASLFLLATGFFTGQSLLPNTFENSFQLSQVETIPNKVVLFIDDPDTKKFSATLDKAEALLQKHDAKDVQVDIVASSGGIDFLRTSTTPYASRIRQLAKTYDSLEFVACNNTLARLRSEGKPVDIIQEAIIAPSAVQFVVQRLQQGWSYVAI